MANKKGKKSELDVICYVIMPGRGPVELDNLTKDERAQWGANMRRNLSTNMSAYFSQHPEEYALI